jgi:hypothetical protein
MRQITLKISRQLILKMTCGGLRRIGCIKTCHEIKVTKLDIFDEFEIAGLALPGMPGALLVVKNV